MTKAREQQISISDTPYYHCIARCVRRAFLCGEDKFTGQDYSHRKQWIVDKIKELSATYAIDVCAYAIMSNHYHIVLHVDEKQAEQWSDAEVIKRWYQLFNGNMLINRFKKGEISTNAELELVDEIVTEWRKRLTDISWFMRCLNESIAREANKEDNCTGRFWEGRFKSQALLDETALLTCMMYVDLNPIRAGLSDTLESSEFTSIHERIAEYAKIDKARNQKKQNVISSNQSNSKITNKSLLNFKGGESSATNHLSGIPFSLLDYFELIDWTGRAIRDDKKGAIPNHISPILNRLGVNETEWVKQVNQFGRSYFGFVGSVEKLQQLSTELGQWWMQGKRCSQKLYLCSG